MKVISLYRFDPSEWQGPPSDEMHANMGKLVTELKASGKLIDTRGVIPSGVLTRVRLNGNGSFTTTDGPFTETKEIVGGFAVFDVASRDEAVRLTERFLSLTGSGMCELIEVSESPE